MLLILSDIMSGIRLIMFGGWFERALMYIGSLFGLQYGWKVPSVRLKVTSRKSTCLRFVWMIIFNSNSFWLSLFLIFLIEGRWGFYSNINRRLCRGQGYRYHTSRLVDVGCTDQQVRTVRLHQSFPLSRQNFGVFLTQCSLFAKSNDVRECIMNFLFLSGIVAYCSAYVNDFKRRSFEIEG